MSNRNMLTPAIFKKIHDIFISKSWKIDDGANESSTFNRFCNLLSRLNLEEQMLVLELTERFTKIQPKNYFDYLEHLFNVCGNDPARNFSIINNIYITALLSPNDFGKSKSGTNLQYLSQGIAHNISAFSGKNISIVDVTNLNSGNINKPDSILILLDDFVGTGDTAIEAIDYLVNTLQINLSKIIILTISILNIGNINLLSQNIPVYYKYIFYRGISDYYSQNEIPGKISVMKSIEKTIKAHKNESLGYKGSEALVSLIRTPNNTFPVFWKEKS